MHDRNLRVMFVPDEDSRASRLQTCHRRTTVLGPERELLPRLTLHSFGLEPAPRAGLAAILSARRTWTIPLLLPGQTFYALTNVTETKENPRLEVATSNPRRRKENMKWF